MKNKKTILIAVLVLVAVCTGVYLAFNNTASKQYGAAEGFMKLYYGAFDSKNLDMLTEEVFVDGNSDEIEALYRDKYENLLTKEAYERLAADRDIFESEQIVKDFGCTLELTDVDFEKYADTVDGNPVYSYNARIKATFPDKGNREFTETGTVELVKEDNQWKVNRLNNMRGNLYKNISTFTSGS